jgi:tRNA dimethylallyltransferase
VYRYCDVGTNKPTADELHGIPCYAIDVVDPGQPFTVADYQKVAHAAIEEISAHGRRPVLQGGTGLYIRALFEGWNLGDAPPDAGLRAALEQRAEEDGVEALDEELRRLDPAAAAQAQHNRRRIIRALEIHASTGIRPSAARRAMPPPWTTITLGLAVPLETLDRRIADRVHRMIDQGFVDEVARVRERFPTVDLRRLGHGYPEMAAYLDGGLSLEGAAESTIRQVRQYARRQLTWFRADARVIWIAPKVDEALARLGTAMMSTEAS